MTRKKVKLAWIENDNSRAKSLKKNMIGLHKKVKELTILCDVRACIIISSPNVAEPVVWPSLETTHGLLDHFFALPKFKQNKKMMSVESYLQKKTKNIHEQLLKINKQEYAIDELMTQIQDGHTNITDLSLSESYALLSFSRDTIISYRKKLDPMQFSPLRDPPVFPFEVQVEELKTTINDVFVGGNQDDERAGKRDEATRRISISTLTENKSHNLIDQWFYPPNPPKPEIYQQIGNENPKPRSYCPYQGSSSNGNHHLEMAPLFPQMMTFHGLAGSISQPSQHHNMNNNPIMVMNPPSQYLFDIMTCEDGVNINNSQFYRSNNTIPTNDGLRQEPPPNGTTGAEDNDDATTFKINRV